MNRDASFELRCVIKRETDAAVLVEVEGADETVWLPFSQIESIHRAPDHAVIVMTRWIAAERGLI